jgi:hypothetical protein
MTDDAASTTHASTMDTENASVMPTRTTRLALAMSPAPNRLPDSVQMATEKPKGIVYITDVTEPGGVFRNTTPAKCTQHNKRGLNK